MTNYVILRRVVFDGRVFWEELTASYARNANAAIGMAAEGGGGPGMYRAVPARFWKPPVTWPRSSRRPADPNECQEGC